MSNYMPLIGGRLRSGALIFLVLALLAAWRPVRAEEVTGPSPDTQVCSRCHDTGQISRSHLKFPGGQSDCLLCHNPHSRAGPPFLRTPEKERCTICHFEYTAKILTEGQKAGGVVHSPALEQKCAECHGPHDLGVPSRYPGGDKNASCAQCHDRTQQQKKAAYQHDPFRSNFCTDCHDPHATKEPRLLRAPPSQLCGSCHKTTQEQFGLPVQHKPFSQGLCTDCHTAHAGNYPKNLKVSVGELCQSCHVPEQNPVQHAPYRAGTCAQCHDAHASRTEKLLAAESIPKLCAQCHAGEVEKFNLPSRHPVGGQMACSSCHRPHTANHEKLLPAEGAELCATCHPGQGRYYDKIGHSSMTVAGTAEKGACTNCHVSHGSANVPLLKGQNGVSLCRTCHRPMSHLEHPTGANALNPETGKPVVCASCHNPHGTRYSASTHKQGDGLCLTCHDR